MPRTARLVVPNYIYHITQRGNYRQNIFQDDEDRLRYLSWIDEKVGWVEWSETQQLNGARKQCNTAGHRQREQLFSLP